jgi:D-methionine transport system substrate-binding protein
MRKDDSHVFKKTAIRTALILSLVILASLFNGCSSAPKETAKTTTKQEVTVKVGAAVVPHAEILNFIKPKLKQEGINLEVIVLDDEA